MIPIILVSTDEKKTQDFVENYANKHHVSPIDIEHIFPQKQEISLPQIKEIKKRIMLYNPQNSLYVLYNFHISSPEAQNALLKALEEHRSSIHFILEVRNIHTVLTTIRSRSIIAKISSKESTTDSNFYRQVEKFISNANSSLLENTYLKGYAKDVDPLVIIDQIIAFFHVRIATDSKAPEILHKALDTRYLVENNHIDPQLAIDHILFSIRERY